MLLVIVAIVGAWWALLVPPWQSVDGMVHFAYTQSLAENFRLPGDPSRPTYSTDQADAANAVGSFETLLYPWTAPPNWNAASWRQFLQTTAVRPPSRGDGGGPNTAAANPPLYYLYAAIGYLIDSRGAALGRLYSIQLCGILLLLATTVGGWLLAGETFGGRRMAQLACASVAGLMPVTAFISTSVNPDAMLITVWTFALWLGARVINRRADAVDCVALCALTSAAILIKATGYALVLPVVLALVMGWLSRPRAERRRHVKVIGLASSVLVLPVLGWIVFTKATGRPTVNPIPTTTPTPAITSAKQDAHPSHVATLPHLYNVGDFLSYLWQFYLPRLPFMPTIRMMRKLYLAPETGLPVYTVWLKQGPAGLFGGALNIFLPAWIYPVVGGLVSTLLVTVCGLLTRLRDAHRLRLLGFYVTVVIALLGFLHVNDYRLIVAENRALLQGRYLLPLVGILGLCVGIIVNRVPARFKAAACGLTLTGVLALEVLALVTLLQVYYI